MPVKRHRAEQIVRKLREAEVESWREARRSRMAVAS